MIVDIVELPSRLRSIKRTDEIVASEIPVCLPICNLARISGYWEPNDEPWTSIGSVHPVITYKDALFRYKFIEPTRYGLAEYFVMTSSPIDVLHPLRTPKVKLVCPWVSLVNSLDLRVRKFILWNGIFELMHYETEDTILDVPAEAVMINELRNLAKLHDRPDLLELLNKYPSDYKNIVVSEEKIDGDAAIDNLLMLKSNISAYETLCVNDEPYYWYDIMDVLRGVNLPETMWSDPEQLPIKGCSLMAHFIYGSATMSELRHLFGMTYDMHAYQRRFNMTPLRSSTDLSIREDDASSKFDVLKYVERLPYSEFELTIDAVKKTGSLKLFNSYDPLIKFDPEIADEAVHHLIDNITKVAIVSFPDASKITIVRSWGEEIYIITLMNDGTKSCSYYDLVSASLGSRTLIRDYSGSF